MFTKPLQFIIGLVSVIGFLIFIYSTHWVLEFFNFRHASLFLLFTLIPFGLIAVMLHELGHAFTVKAFGREVHFIGIGWNWLFPIAFTDTSDIWLSPRRERMIVNLAGVYVDVFIAGLVSIPLIVINNPYIDCLLWLFALYAYIHAFRMMSPFQNMDGYYLLMDWVEKNRLRYAAVQWAMSKFPKAIKDPRLFRENKPEVYYWIACFVYILLISIVALVLQNFILKIIGWQMQYKFLSLILPISIFIVTSFLVVADIRAQAKK